MNGVALLHLISKDHTDFVTLSHPDDWAGNLAVVGQHCYYIALINFPIDLFCHKLEDLGIAVHFWFQFLAPEVWILADVGQILLDGGLVHGIRITRCRRMRISSGLWRWGRGWLWCTSRRTCSDTHTQGSHACSFEKAASGRRCLYLRSHDASNHTGHRRYWIRWMRQLFAGQMAR